MLRRLLVISVFSFQCGVSLADEASPSAPPTLCSAAQTPVFSCSVGTKTASLCASTGHLAKDDLVLQYKFGVLGKTPELTFPADGRLVSKAFSFTVIQGAGGSTWVVSFDNKPASYDVMSDLKGDALPQYSFTGLGITVGEGQTQFRSCNPGPLIMNMKLLNDQGFFPEYTVPKHDDDKPPFRVITKTIQHGPKWTSTIEYPVVGDTTLDARIEAFAKDCYSDESGDAGHCNTTVAAELALGKYLTLEFTTYEYEEGMAHGDGESALAIYMRQDGKWLPIADNSLIAKTSECKKRYASLLNRRVRPEMTLKAADESAPDFDDIFNAARQVLIRDGVLFSFPQYTFGPRVPPQPIFVDFKSLGACFAPQLAPASSGSSN